MQKHLDLNTIGDVTTPREGDISGAHPPDERDAAVVADDVAGLAALVINDVSNKLDLALGHDYGARPAEAYAMFEALRRADHAAAHRTAHAWLAPKFEELREQHFAREVQLLEWRFAADSIIKTTLRQTGSPVPSALANALDANKPHEIQWAWSRWLFHDFPALLKAIRDGDLEWHSFVRELPAHLQDMAADYPDRQAEAAALRFQGEDETRRLLQDIKRENGESDDGSAIRD